MDNDKAPAGIHYQYDSTYTKVPDIDNFRCYKN